MRSRRTGIGVGLSVLALLGCSQFETRNWVSERAQARMSTNQLYNLGLEHLRARDYPACETVFRKVLRRKRMTQAFANLGFCLAAGTPPRLEEALAYYDEALRVDPAASEAYLGRGALHVWARRPEQARADLDRLRALAPARAHLLAALIENGSATRETTFERQLGSYGPMPTPRQAPRGILGD